MEVPNGDTLHRSIRIVDIGVSKVSQIHRPRFEAQLTVKLAGSRLS